MVLELVMILILNASECSIFQVNFIEAVSFFMKVYFGLFHLFKIMSLFLIFFCLRICQSHCLIVY